MKGKKKRIINSAVAVGCAVAVIFTGTFAWQAMSSAMNAFNDTQDEQPPKTPPSANLHDDFNPDDGTKRIYAENTGTTAVYVRIKLEEYLDLTATDNKNQNGQWTVHMPVSTGTIEKVVLDGDLHKEEGANFAWTMGGHDAYDSITSDSKWKNAADQKERDLLVADSEGGAAASKNYYGSTSTVVKPDGTVKKIMDASDGVITMNQYLAKDSGERAAFTGWVYDRDGFAYWSQPVLPGHATGMLLKSVKTPEKGTMDYYYAINAIMEYVDQEDLGAWTDIGKDGERVTTLNENGQVATSSKDKGAIINSGKQEGQTTIEATKDAKKIFEEIGKVPATGVTVTPATLSMAVGDSEALSATLTPSDSTDSITWSSSDPAIATVDENGNVTAKAVGTVEIIATASSGKTGTCNVTITEKTDPTIPLEDFTVTAPENMTTGDKDKIEITYDPADADHGKPTFTSDDPTVVSVDEDGNIEALKPGEATITINVDGEEKTITIVVTDEEVPLTGISLTGDKKMVREDTQTLVVNYEPENATHGAPVFESSDPSIATVDPATGEVTAVKAGEVTIAVTVDEKTAKLDITVEGKNDLDLKETDNAKFNEAEGTATDEYGRRYESYHSVLTGYNATDTGYYYCPTADKLPGSNQQGGEYWESYAMAPFTFYVDDPSKYTFEVTDNDEWDETTIVEMDTVKGKMSYIQGTHLWTREQIDGDNINNCKAEATIRITEDATGDYRDVTFKYSPYAFFFVF